MKGENSLNVHMLNPALSEYIEDFIGELDLIDQTRKEALESIGDYILEAYQKRGSASMVMVCTHNSRRSHLSQVWLQTAAYYYGISGFKTFSGGTEATAANIRAMDALSRAGFNVEKAAQAEPNQRYRVTPGPGYPEELLFSKVFNDPINPAQAFGTVMVCTDADEACPNVPGADARFSLPFRDPKYADNTPEELEAYDHATSVIGREMFYIARYVQRSMQK